MQNGWNAKMRSHRGHDIPLDKVKNAVAIF